MNGGVDGLWWGIVCVIVYLLTFPSSIPETSRPSSYVAFDLNSLHCNGFNHQLSRIFAREREVLQSPSHDLPGCHIRLSVCWPNNIGCSGKCRRLLGFGLGLLLKVCLCELP